MVRVISNSTVGPHICFKFKPWHNRVPSIKMLGTSYVNARNSDVYRAAMLENLQSSSN